MKYVLHLLIMLGISPMACCGLVVGYVFCIALKGDNDKLAELEREVKEKRLKEENKRYTQIKNVENAKKLFE